MARIRLKLDIDLTAFENDLVAAITARLPKVEEAAVREAIKSVLASDMVVAEMCGRRIFCSEVEAFEPFQSCEEK